MLRKSPIDPFDVFDISRPEEGVKYLNRLTIDGWIERAIPMTHEGRQFVLGLGWIVPATDESGRRRPQASIFEVTRGNDGKVNLVQAAKYSFTGTPIWANFDDQDKMIEIRQTGEGKGEVLFGADKYENRTYHEGGQLLSFDLQAVVSSRPDSALRRGAFIDGGSDWIRRVFTNPEINRINTFSDRQLATFGQVEGEGDLHPVHVLELARDISGYETLADGGKNYGVQMIDNDSWYNANAKTALRLVQARAADTEKTGMLSEITLTGNYIDHHKDEKTGALLVLTSRYLEAKRNSSGRYDYQTEVQLARVQAKGGKLSVRSQVQWTFSQSNDPEPAGRVKDLKISLDGTDGFVQLADGSVLVQTDSVIQVVDLSSGLKAAPLQLKSCTVKDRTNIAVHAVGGAPYLRTSDVVESRQYKGLEFARNWLAPLKLKGAVGECEPEVNIPGDPLLVTQSGEFLTNDEAVKKISRRGRGEYRYWSVETQPLLSGLAKGAKAELRDQVKLNRSYDLQIHPLSSSKLVRLNSSESTRPLLSSITLGSGGDIVEETFSIDTKLGRYTDLVLVTPVKGIEGKYLGLLRNEQSMQVVSWTDSSSRPVVTPVTPIGTDFRPGSPVDTVVLPASYWSRSYHYSPELKSFEVTQGLSGITQFIIQ